MIKRIVLVVILLALGLAAPALAAEPGSGIIEGQLVNGTEGGSSVANQDITLKTYQNNNEIGSATTKTDAEGRFIFDKLRTESSYGYYVQVTYQQAPYQSDLISFAQNETTKSLEFPVWDSTTNGEAIKMTIAHTVISAEQPGSLSVTQYFLFVNEADRTYIGSGKVFPNGQWQTLKFPLPEEVKVTELQVGTGLMDCCIYDSEDGFVDTMPVLPGVREVSYSYTVSYSSGTYTLSWKVDLPADAYELLVQGEGVVVSSDQLSASELLDIEGTSYNHLSGKAFSPGDTVVITLSGLPKGSNQGKQIVWWVLGTLLVLGSGFGYLLRKKGLQPVRTGASLDQRRQRLLLELAQLDDDFESGRIPETVYRKQRAKKKDQLVELIKKPRGESSG